MVPHTPEGWDPTALGDFSSWRHIPALSAFVLANGSGPPRDTTTVRLVWDERALWVRFDCVDRDPWSSYSQRDDPLWREEVVEVFLAPVVGDETPADYTEIEISPRGVVFDARVSNPHGDRKDMIADIAWNCPGLRWEVGRLAEGDDWWAMLAIPWRGILPAGEPLPNRWRANFFRIERPRGEKPQFSAWSSPGTDPPDFHRPAAFGWLDLSLS